MLINNITKSYYMYYSCCNTHTLLDLLNSVHRYSIYIVAIITNKCVVLSSLRRPLARGRN